MRRAAVLGHPISHSLSPVLHRAAYAALGLDWTYDAIDVEAGGLAQFLAGCGDEWAGLSLTMPLKLEAAALADAIEPQARLVGPINTLVASGKGEYRQWVGANTDIHGIVAALSEAGCSRVGTAVVLGGGATATSALAALGSMGATRPWVAVRSKARAGGLLRAGSRMGLTPRLVDIDAADTLAALAEADAVVSTIPVDAGASVASRLGAAGYRPAGVLLDVVYDPLVTPLVEGWVASGGRTVSGTRMLLHQAHEQVRLMTAREPSVGAMETALNGMLDIS